MIPAYEPNDIYTITVYDHTGNLYLTLRQWDRLEFSQRLNDPWNHTIQVRVSPDDSLGNTLRELPRDYFVIVERFDTLAQVTDRVYEGFHATSREQTQTDGNIFFQLFGGGFTKLLDRRVVVPPPGQENSNKSGPAETLMKEYVYECGVSPTGLTITDDISEMQTTSFIDPARIIQGLSIVPTQGRGIETEYSARFTNLNSVIKKLSEDGLLDYGIYGGDELGEFVFDARPLWGKDLRKDNSEGNTPVIFSLELGNMLIPILSINHRHEKNWVYAGGNGSGTKRIIAQAWDDEAIIASPWGRSELFVDNRQGEDYTTTLASARAAVEQRGVKEEFNFDIRQTRTSRWLRNWNLGDYVSAEYRGREFDRQIVEIAVVVSSGGQQIEQITVDLKEINTWQQVYQEVTIV